MSACRSWTIGASANCDAVIDAPTVSSRHCCLTQSGDGWVLEDLSSTNGTFCNGQRVTQATRVAANDRIRLGHDVEIPGRVRDLVNQLQAEPLGTHSSKSLFQVPTHRVVVASLIFMLGLLSFSFGHWNDQASIAPTDQSVAGNNHSTPLMDSPADRNSEVTASATTLVGNVAPNSSTTVDEESNARHESQPAIFADVAPVAQTTVDGQQAAFQPKPAVSQRLPIDPAQAVYSVLIRDAQTARTSCFGTAWAARESLLVTSGAVVYFLQTQPMKSSTITVRCEATGREFVVVDTKLHPHFARQLPDIERATLDLIAQGERLDTARRDGMPLTPQLNADYAATRVKLERATERGCFFDLGTLKIEGTLSDQLPIASNDAANSVQRPIHFLGGMRPATNNFSNQLKLRPRGVTCDRGVMLTEELADEVLYRWQWQIPEQPAEIDWVGSPVLDGSGCVVGVVSRRAPAANAHIQSEHDVDRLDVVSVQQLRDLITEPLE